ncbi:MAG TPA: phosphosulfolactate synthase [Nitrososphaerales archaeon]|nr:phosphosulfolactate synthase [Nitrososphaerales archaeon]
MISSPGPADAKRERRTSGLTMVLDRLSGLVESEFDQASSYVDIVEIGWGLPLVWREDSIISRVKFYKRHGISVSLSGTLLEYFFFQNRTDAILDKAQRLGFDTIEISDGIIDMTKDQKARIVRAVKSRGLDYLVAVGKKDPATQLSLPETISQIGTALALEPRKVVLEGRARGRDVGIYDSEGEIRWNLLRAITDAFDHRDLVFEAPLENQQDALIAEFGPDVNLGNVALASIASLQSERLGLRFETFRVKRSKEPLSGGPSVKFVLFVIRHYQPIDQRGIAAASQLPRRTIQKAVEYLLLHKLITEHSSFEDGRSKIYRTPSVSLMDRAR